MNIPLTSSHGDIPMCQCQIKKLLRAGQENMSKPYKFDLHVKGQCSVGIMNVCDILSHSDTTMYHVYGMPMSIKENVSGQTRICTDRQTQCRQSDSYIPPELCLRGIKYHHINYLLSKYLEPLLHQFHCV